MYCNIFTWHISDYQKKECVDIIHFTTATVRIHNIWSLLTSLTLLHTNTDINIASETKIQDISDLFEHCFTGFCYNMYFPHSWQ